MIMRFDDDLRDQLGEAVERIRDLKEHNVLMREALEAYLNAKPQCECNTSDCQMEAARILARKALEY